VTDTVRRRSRTWPRPETWDLIEQVACPRCDAGPGQPCRTPGGVIARPPHAARRNEASLLGLRKVYQAEPPPEQVSKWQQGAPLPAGPQPRTWTVELPAGMELLSMNGRQHWSEQRRRGAELRKAAWATAKAIKIPPLAAALITVTYQPPDKRRRDHDNIPAQSGKHCIDGIVDAGILPDDCPPYVAGISYAIGNPHPGGRLVLTLTEVTAGD
jgi:crossover junction endodeoxyribonuclease RusA